MVKRKVQENEYVVQAVQHKGEAFEELRSNFDVYKRTIKNDIVRVKSDINIMTAKLKSNNDLVTEVQKEGMSVKM